MNDLTNPRIIGKFFAKHHPVIFIVSILLLIAAAVFSLNQVIEQTLGQTPESQNTNLNFDQATIDQIKKLHTSSDAPESIQFPSPRPNPFVES
jgi:uncharacterized membrane protein